MARLSADKSSCLALVVQSPLAAAHGKADVRIAHPCSVSMHAGDGEHCVEFCSRYRLLE